MPCYNFKSITVVPSSKDFIDIVLSKTQRKTPTVIHKQYAIGRIRHFYIRKVKTCQQFYHDKLQTIITDFPAVEADNLKFLEDTRQHMSRLPTIDPDTRTLVLCGFPNVGKSSFINKITRADVDVQPFPFTTKSLFVGHTDYNNLRWQVIDTPGVLNRPLDQHNTVEMLSITALAHLQAAVIYIMDLSEQCGYTIQQQLELFQNLRPLFRNKPLIIAANKTDLISFDDIADENKEAIKKIVRFSGNESDFDAINDERPLFIQMSTVSEDGIVSVRSAACNYLLAQRVQNKLRVSAMPNTDADVASRLYIAKPGSESNTRPPIIPPNALAKQQARALKRNMLLSSLNGCIDSFVDGRLEAKKKRTMRDRELEADPYEGFILNLREHWSISHPDHANDIIPEIMDGHNLIDMFDPDIEEKLNKLEEQEADLEAINFYEQSDWTKDEDKNNPEMQRIRIKAGKIREARALCVLESRARKNVRKPQIPRSSRSVSVRKMRHELGERGLKVDMQKEVERGQSLKRAARIRNSTPNLRREESIARTSVSRSRSGVRDDKMEQRAKRLGKLSQRKMVRLCRKGEGDRHIPTLKPKHLFSGKRSAGTANHR